MGLKPTMVQTIKHGKSRLANEELILNIFIHLTQSHQLPDVSSGFDAGRLRMARMMAQKEAHWRQIRACRAEGSCTEMSMKQSDGPAECVDGRIIFLI